MRQIVYDYIEKPSKKLRERLTDMELQWADAQMSTDKPAPKPKPEKK